MPQAEGSSATTGRTAEAISAAPELVELCELAPVAYLTLDAKGRVRAANAATAERLGVSAEDLLGRLFVDFVGRGHKRRFHRHLRECETQRTGASCELPLDPASGEPISVRLETVLEEHHEGAWFRVAVTERQQAEQSLLLVARVLSVLNRPGKRLHILRDVLHEIKRSTGFDAVGIRLREGEDFPYYLTSGFPEEFVAAERYLCGYDSEGRVIRDEQGRADLECMCGNVIRGRTDASLPFYSESGSFWTNSTSDLLAGWSGSSSLPRTRNRCHIEGYESVALIPLRAVRETIGLLQLNDRRRDRFTADSIRFFEGLGSAIGIGLARQEAEEALRDSEFRYRVVTQNLIDVIWTASIRKARGGPPAHSQADRSRLGEEFLRRFRFSFLSPSIRDLLGYDAREAMRLGPRDLLTPRSYAMLQSRLGAVLAADPTDEDRAAAQLNLELEHVTHGGDRRWCEVTFKFLREPGQGIVGLVGSTRDISERRELEQALSNLAAEERAKIGRGLHDGLGQQLTGIGYMAASLRADLQGVSSELAEGARRLVTATQQALEQTRKIAKGLLPVEIDPLGLMSALEQLIESAQQLYGIPGRFECPRPVAIADAKLATELFRIAQEAVANAARHSRAQILHVALTAEAGAICLEIHDDGVGIAPAGSRADGLGLRIMRYRAGLIGASLEVRQAEDGGTVVACRVTPEEEDGRNGSFREEEVPGPDRR